MVLTERTTIEFYLEDSEMKAGHEILGTTPHFAAMYLSLIRRRGFAWKDIVPVFLEEICHSLYQIKNEYEIKYLVRDICGQKLPIHLHSFYRGMFDENDYPLFLEECAEDYYEITRLTPP